MALKHLVIVESPAKAKTINKYLGNQYKVEASMGHIRDLPKSKLGVDLDNQFEPKYVNMGDKRKIISKLKKAAKEADVIYLAADPDREGEAICWHLKHILQKGFKGDIKRVSFNEITPGAVREAFLTPKEINDNLVNAQQARRILDRIVGYKLSPLLWKKVAKGLSAGRVQSVALKIIIDREREIRAFKPEEYWSIEALLASFKDEYKNLPFTAKLDKINGEKAEVSKQEESDKIISELENADYIVKSVKERAKQRKPQPPFITSKLQQEAYGKLRFPAQKTMRTAQSLYEGVNIGTQGTVGLITYMRTDSVNVSKGAMEEVREYINEQYGDDFLSPKPNIFKSRKRAQEAHEAIRPTSVSRTPDEMRQYLDEDQLKLYTLIWKRFVASQMSNAKDMVQTIEIEAAEKYLFKTSLTRNIFPGFSKVYDYRQAKKKDDIVEVPPLTQGEKVDLRELKPEQHFTKPPARFNDASLVKTLEELGIGRPSTYAPTIQTLINRNYVERMNSALHPTEMAELVIDLLVKCFEYLLEVEFTANMEDDLDSIEDGKKEWRTVLDLFYKPFAKKLEDAQENVAKVKKEVVITDQMCEKCGKPLAIKWGRYGKFLACTGFPDCSNTKPLPTGVKCPNEGCDGDLVKRSSKRGRPFYGCSNYPNCKFIANKLPQQDKDKSPEGADNGAESEE